MFCNIIIMWKHATLVSVPFRHYFVWASALCYKTFAYLLSSFAGGYCPEIC